MAGRKFAPKRLLIFDCDGVLVDSEVISVRVLSEVLSEQGLPVDAAYVYSNFLGRSMSAIAGALQIDFDYRMTEPTLEAIRLRMQASLRRDLTAVPGIGAALRKLPDAKCVASSSRPERIRLSLELTGLVDEFAPNIFSATMVKRGKPEPDLFLYAARRMKTKPQNCVVIEDSPAGVEAAKRAGMRVLAFAGGAHAAASNLHSALAALTPDVIFDDMLRLPELLAEEPVST